MGPRASLSKKSPQASDGNANNKNRMELDGAIRDVGRRHEIEQKSKHMVEKYRNGNVKQWIQKGHISCHC